MRLHGIVEQDEQGYDVAEVPALPGCLLEGESRRGALANIREAIEGWLEVMQSRRFLDPHRAIAVVV